MHYGIIIFLSFFLLNTIIFHDAYSIEQHVSLTSSNLENLVKQNQDTKLTFSHTFGNELLKHPKIIKGFNDSLYVFDSFYCQITIFGVDGNIKEKINVSIDNQSCHIDNFDVYDGKIYTHYDFSYHETLNITDNGGVERFDISSYEKKGLEIYEKTSANNNYPEQSYVVEITSKSNVDCKFQYKLCYHGKGYFKPNDVTIKTDIVEMSYVIDYFDVYDLDGKHEKQFRLNSIASGHHHHQFVIDDGFIYLFYEPDVLVFDLDGNLKRKFYLDLPHTDFYNRILDWNVKNNSIYVLHDYDLKQSVSMFNNYGAFTNKFDISSDILAFVADDIEVFNDLIYFLDSNNKKVKIFLHNGSHVKNFENIEKTKNSWYLYDMMILDYLVYVTTSNAILIYDLEGELQDDIGKPLTNQLVSPSDILTYDDHVYIIEEKQDEISLFDNTGSYVYSFGYKSEPGETEIRVFDTELYDDKVFLAHSAESLFKNGTLSTGKIILSEGTLLIDEKYLDRDITLNYKPQIKIFNFSDGKFLTKIEQDGWKPTDIELYKNRLYVLDSNSSDPSYFEPVIWIFDLDGNFLTKFGKHGTDNGEFSRSITSITLYDDRLYVLDSLFSHVHIFDLDGNFLTKFGVRGHDYGELFDPHSIKVYKNLIYVLDDIYHDAHIEIFDLDGNFLTKFNLEQNLNYIKTPTEIELDNDRLFIFMRGMNQVSIFYISDISSTNNSSQISTINIPEWIKTNVKWWSKDKISSEDFVKSIEYLVEQKVIQINNDKLCISKNSDYDIRPTVPNWFKQNAEWWHLEKISNTEFLDSIQHLIQIRVIANLNCN